MTCQSPGGEEGASWRMEQPAAGRQASRQAGRPAGRQAGQPGTFYLSLRTCLSLSSLHPATMLPNQRTQLVIFEMIVAELTTKSLIIG